MKQKYYRGLTKEDIEAYKLTGRFPANPAGFIQVVSAHDAAVASGIYVIWVDARYVDKTGEMHGSIHGDYMRRALRGRLWDFDDEETGDAIDKQMVADMKARHARRVEEPGSSGHEQTAPAAKVH